VIIRDGRVRRSWTGLEVQPLLEGDDRPGGVLVSGVIAGAPAERAGLRAGDVLLTWDGRAVTARHAEELPASIRSCSERRSGPRSRWASSVAGGGRPCA